MRQKCNKIIDSIIRSYDNGEFASLIRDGKTQTKHTPVEWKLATISCLLTSGAFLERKDAIDLAKDLLQKLENFKFSDQSGSCLIIDDKSFTPWNAWMSIIHFKLNDNFSAEMYLSSLLREIRTVNIPAYFSRTTPDDIFNENQKIQSPTGIIILSLIWGYINTGKNSYLLSAKEIGKLSINKSRFDPHDVWSMRLLFDKFQDPLFMSHAEYILSQTDAVSILSMASLVASMVQQANLAWLKYMPHRVERCQKVLNYQLSLQSDGGGFMRSKNNNEIRLDYSYHNLISLMQYEFLLTNQSTDEKTILSLVA